MAAGLRWFDETVEATKWLGDDILGLAERNLTGSGDTVLVYFPGYIDKANARGASYFDLGDAWNSLDDAQRWAANKHFLDLATDQGDRVLLSLPKTEIRPGSWLAREVQYLTQGKGYVWVNQSGRTYKTKTIKAGTPLRHSNFTQRIWKPAVRDAGLPEGLRIHDLRHTAAALMIAAGAHPEHIKRHLGHSSITVTMDQYGHLFPSESAAIAERLDVILRDSQTDKIRTKRPSTDSDRADEERKSAPEQGLFEWARQDSNLGPTDYEPEDERSADQGESPETQ